MGWLRGWCTVLLLLLLLLPRCGAAGPTSGLCPTVLLNVSQSASGDASHIELYLRRHPLGLEHWAAELGGEVVRCPVQYKLYQQCFSCCGGSMHYCPVMRSQKPRQRKSLPFMGRENYTAVLREGSMTLAGGNMSLQTARTISTWGLRTEVGPVTCPPGSVRERRPVVVLPMLKPAVADNPSHIIAETLSPIVRATGGVQGRLLVPVCGPCKLPRKPKGWGHRLLATDMGRCCTARPPLSTPDTLQHRGLRRIGADWLERMAPVLHAAQGRAVCIDTLRLPCFRESCPLTRSHAGAAPMLQSWLAAEYNFSFSPLRDQRPLLVLLLRRPNGTRFIGNAAALLAAAEGKGMRTAVLHGHRTPAPEQAALFQRASVVVSMHGSDIPLALMHLRRGSILVEVLGGTGWRYETLYTDAAVSAGLYYVQWTVGMHRLAGDQTTPSDGCTESGWNQFKYCRMKQPLSLPLDEWSRVLDAALRVLAAPAERPEDGGAGGLLALWAAAGAALLLTAAQLRLRRRGRK